MTQASPTPKKCAIYCASCISADGTPANPQHYYTFSQPLHPGDAIDLMKGRVAKATKLLRGGHIEATDRPFMYVQAEDGTILADPDGIRFFRIA